MTQGERTNRTTWKPGQSGNPHGRPSGTERVRQLLEDKREELVTRAVEMAMAGDAQVMRALLDRLAPAPRTQHPAVEIPGMPTNGTASEKAGAIVDAMGSGLISPDAGALMLGAIASAVKVREFEELEARLAALEKQRGNT